MIPASEVGRITRAAPFWLSLMTVPLVLAGAAWGGVWTLLLPLYAWGLFTLLDALTGLYEENADPATPEARLFWYRLVTLVWFPLQAAIQFGLIWYATRAGHLDALEKAVLFFGVGVISGTVGINYAHELMHQKNRLERWLADLLLATVLYAHFRSEHLRVHHSFVGTPRDPVTARYNEGFHRFFPRVLRQSPVSAFRAEAACPGGTRRTRSGAISRCRRRWSRWRSASGGGRGSRCSSGRRWSRSGSSNSSTTSSTTA